MRRIQRAGLTLLMVVGSVVAHGYAPEHLAAWPVLLAASASPTSAAESSGDGEIWVTAQNTDELKILSGMGGLETVTLPAGAGPHTINFSPDGSYAYVSSLGNGELVVVRAEDRQIVARLELGGVFTHDTKASPDGSILLSANPMTGILTRIAVDEAAETWTPDASLDLRPSMGQGPVCVTFRADGERAYVSLFGPAGGIAVVDVPNMAVVGRLATAGSVSGCGTAKSNDGRTIFLVSSGGQGHLYRLDTDTESLTEDTGYGPIGANLHGLAVSANEKRAYVAAIGDQQVKVLDLNGSDVSSITLPHAPDSMVRQGSNIYVTLRFAGQLARIKTQSGAIDYTQLAPPSLTGWAIHGIAVRP